MNSNSTAPLVYIVILNYNDFNETISCLKSIDKVSYVNYRIVIVDNCSTDNSIKHIKNYFSKINQKYKYHNNASKLISNNSKINIIKSDYNGGYGYGNNIGIRFSMLNNTDYVLIINNDTVVNSCFLTNMINQYENSSNIGILSSKICFYEDPEIIWFNGGSFSKLSSKIIHYNFNEKDSGQVTEKEITFITGCLWLIPNHIIKEVGYINEDYFMYIEDLEYCYRVLSHGYKLNICNESIIYHKKKIDYNQRNQSTFSKYYISKNKVKFIIKYYKSYFKIISLIYTIVLVPIRLLFKKRADLSYASIKGGIDGFFK